MPNWQNYNLRIFLTQGVKGTGKINTTQNTEITLFAVCLTSCAEGV